MRVLLSLAVVVLVTSACPSLLAPPPTSGAAAGAPCAANVDCAAGLACECGQCAEPTGQAPRCLELDDACGDVPSDCFAACGDPTVIGQAECVGGRESCAAVNGVLVSQCDEDECWEPAAPGEVCIGGELECQFPPRAPNGHCYTFDCEGTPGSCVEACGDGSAPFPETCIASEWQCEVGVPAEECGECVGAVPRCVLDCAGLMPAGVAACNPSREWTCAHIIQDGTPAEVVSDCCDENPAACPPDAGPADDGGAPDAGDAGDDGGPDSDAGDGDGGPVVDGGASDAGSDDASVPDGVDGGDGHLDAGDGGAVDASDGTTSDAGADAG